MLRTTTSVTFSKSLLLLSSVRPSNKSMRTNGIIASSTSFDFFYFTTFCHLKLKENYDILECIKNLEMDVKQETWHSCNYRYGTMNSGKTIEILKVAYNYEGAKEKVL